jgi:hypothetical protein
MLMAISGTAISVAPDVASYVSNPPVWWVESALRNIGVLTAACAAVCLLAAAIIALNLPFTISLRTFEFLRGRYVFFPSQAGVGDLDELYRHYTDLFGPELVPQAQMASWIQKNPSIAWRVLRYDQQKQREPPQLIGFFDIEPLTAEGEQKLRKESASTLALEKPDIRSKKAREGRAYYIGSVGALKGRHTLEAGVTMIFFIQALENLCRNRNITVYARPATDDGVYLVREEFRMVKLYQKPDKEAVWVKEITASDFRSQEKYSRLAARLKLQDSD